MTDTVEFSFPQPAPAWSVNARHHWTKTSKWAKAWRLAACVAAQEALGVGTTLPPSIIEVHIPFGPRGGKGDPHNYSSTVLKHVVDGLGPTVITTRKGKRTLHPGAGLWPDDRPKYVSTLEPVLYVGELVVVRITPR